MAKEELKALSPAHRALTDKVKLNAKTLVSLIEESSRDYEVMRDLLEELISYQHGADVVSGQYKEPRNSV